eukprot:GHVR01084853.1.p1 GENE.GHVR01084853.1~~GHVR01084853.1.p1  ORF type:complete len:486 (-),score=24.79 GHVR01084853.1:93-1550(-)
MMKPIPYFITIFILFVCFTCDQKDKLTPDETKSIAKEAYIYGFPIVMNYKTMYNFSLNEQSPAYRGPINQKSCYPRLFTPEDKTVVTPNADTPYCGFWMDLRDEPQVISVPEMEAERFYHFQLVDLYTHNFAYIGTLTNENKFGNYLITRQDWEGEKPEGITDIIRCETDLFFVIVRTQLFGNDDLVNVKAIQDAYEVQSLNFFLGKESIDSEPIVKQPFDSEPNREETVLVWNDGAEFTTGLFTYLNYMLNLTTPIASEIELRNMIAMLGIGTKEGFDINRFDEVTQKAIEEGVAEGLQEMKDFLIYSKDPLLSAKIFGTRDFLTKSAKENYNLDNLYILRATAAFIGLYGNTGSEAIYPAYLMEAPDVPFNGATNKYTLTFIKDELPPVNAFWSFSMYDGNTQLFIDNSLNRYKLNSSSLDEFVYGEDGSLTLYIQKDSPGAELEPNWLPAPDGPFYCVMRLYGPKEEALSGEWVNPPLLKTN